MSKQLHILIACGGTGGHVFPGLATGQVLQQRGHCPELWVTGRSVENDVLRGWDGPVFRTGARPLGIGTLPAFAATLWRVWRQMRRERPDVVLAMGCYSSVPPVLVARLMGIPVVLHEANAVPGKAVAFLSRFARVTALSFAASARYLPCRRTVVTGMPVRTSLAGQPPLEGFAQPGRARAPHAPAIEASALASTPKEGGGSGGPALPEPQPPAAATESAFTVLITGGSLGAHAVNELACEALLLLHKQGTTGIRVIHQCGPADEATLRARYAAAGVAAQVHAFLREMGRAYASADLAICRAGAATCFELCLCGVPAVLIPLPAAVRDHQRLNAEALVQSGGALLRIQADTTPAQLAADIESIRADPARRIAMRQALLTLAAPDAAEKLAELVCNQ
jgi:UDP-N-acetylglucosamine--N-acetylmuramyl-(pentapeptide) pyrophosphoryl-undecaprenol N-acetylglucosamine transferase